MEIAEVLPAELPVDVDSNYEMRISAPSHLPLGEQHQQQPRQDDVMVDEAAAAAATTTEEQPLDGMMAEEYEEYQQPTHIAPSADAEIEFVEEAAEEVAKESVSEAMSIELEVTQQKGVDQATHSTTLPAAASSYPPLAHPVTASDQDTYGTAVVADNVLPSATSVQEVHHDGSHASTPPDETSKHAAAATSEVTAPVETHEVDELAATSYDQTDELQDEVVQVPAAKGNQEADELVAHEGAEDDQLEHSTDSEDGTAPPTIRLSFNGQDFVLFSHDEPTFYLGASQHTAAGADHKDMAETAVEVAEVAAPKLTIADDAFWQPLESVFASLRVKDCLGEFLEEATELVLHMPDLDLTVQEDNLYCREITLDDLFQLHQGLGYSTSLHILVTEAQRFISKYNMLAQHVASMIEQAHDEHEAHGDGEQDGGDAAAAEQTVESQPRKGYHAHPAGQSGAVTAASAPEEKDELESGHTDPQAAAQVVEEIVSAENAQTEDRSHEVYDETPDYREAAGEGEEVPAATEQQPGGPNVEEHGTTTADNEGARLPRSIAGDPAASAGEATEASKDAGEAVDGHNDGEQEEADQTYVTVNEEGGEDEVDEIDDGDDDGGEEGKSEGDGAIEDAGEQTEEWNDDEAYEDGGDWHEDEAEEESLEEGEGTDGLEEGEEEEDLDAEAAGHEYAGEEDYEDEGADGSVTIDGSDDAVEPPFVEAGDEHNHTGEDEIVEYEDPEEGENVGDGDDHEDNAPTALEQAEADDNIYGEDAVAAPAAAASAAAAAPSKRALDDSSEAGQPVNGDLKRAKVGQ